MAFNFRFIALLATLPFAAAGGTHSDLEDLSASCAARLTAMYTRLYPPADGQQDACVPAIQQALVLRDATACPDAEELKTCFTRHADEWIRFDSDCGLFHYQGADGEGEEAHAPGEDPVEDEHEVTVGCFPKFESSRDFAAYATSQELPSSDQSAAASAAVSGIAAVSSLLIALLV